MTDSHSDAGNQNALVGEVLGRITSGVFILTANDQTGRSTGMLASWVQQASFEPLMVTVAVNRSRYLNRWLEASPRLVLNIVGEGQKHYLKHFGAGFEEGSPAFHDLDITQSPAGLPVLAGALGYLEGRVCQQFSAGDHHVYLVELTAAGRGVDFSELKPMVHLRKSGLHY